MARNKTRRKKYKTKNKKTKARKIKKRNNKLIKRQSGGSLFTHMMDNDFFNWILYAFQGFFNTFFGFENNVINPSIMKGQFA